MIYGNHTPEVSVTEASLLRRVEIFLEDGEFDRADEYCERVLDMNVENAEAYFYKLLASLQLSSSSELSSLEAPFDTHPCYAKIMRFGSEQLKREIEGINAAIIKKAEERKKALSFERAVHMLDSQSISELTEAYRIFNSLGDYENAAECAGQCGKRIEAIYDSRYNELYLAAKQKEQEINDRQYQSSTDILEKDDYDQYIKDNTNKKVFDYSFLVAAAVVIIGLTAIFFASSEYLTLAGISFKTVLRCIFTKIVPGIPLTGLATVLSFHISKKLVKKQRANHFEDISTAAERAKEIGEKISSAESEAFMLKRELDEALEALKRLNSEYDVFVAERERAQAPKLQEI